MGINKFNELLKKEYPECITIFDPLVKYDYTFIDMNHILHSCTIKSNIAVEDKLRNKIKTFMNIVNSNVFYLVIDGSAPYAKMLLQRKRRVSMKNLEDDSCNLIPGTKLIKSMEDIIKNIIIDIKKDNPRLDMVVHYSFSEIVGEGEIKINNILTTIYDKKVLIIGNDADIIVMSIARTKSNNLDVDMYNNLPHQVTRVKVSKIVNTRMNSKFCNNFVFASILLGNDYLPRLKNMKVDNLINTFKKTFLQIVDYDYLVINKKANIDSYSGMRRFFRAMMCTYPKSKVKFNIEKYKKDDIKNYIDGIFWCLYLYIAGTCLSYDFTCTVSSPNICDVVYYLENETLNFEELYSCAKPIDHKVYPLFLMPIKFVPDIYKDIISEFEKNIDSESINQMNKKLLSIHTK